MKIKNYNDNYDLAEPLSIYIRPIYLFWDAVNYVSCSKREQVPGMLDMKGAEAKKLIQCLHRFFSQIQEPPNDLTALLGSFFCVSVY